MRLVFAGTPDAAVPSLDALVASRHDVVAVLTRPDAPAGRGRSLAASPVRVRAHQHGLEVLTPDRPSDPQFQQRLRELAPQVCPIVAYGGLVPLSALTIPARGWVNLHFSLLPAWRGAAPVQRSLIAGDEVTGATTFQLEQGLDTGPILGMMTETIKATDTAGDLLGRLAEAGAELLVATLDAMEAGDLHAVPQPADGVSLAPKLTVEDARIRWAAPALAVERHIRGCTPAPGAWTTFRGERLKVLPVQLDHDTADHDTADHDTADHDGAGVGAGRIVATRRTVHVGTATAAVRLGVVQPHGRKAMTAADWARGARLGAGEKLGDD